MKISFPVILVAALAALACSPRPRSAVTPVVTVRDDVGRSVALATIPQRIASLAPSATEMIYALGCGDRIIGVTSWCDYPPQAKQQPVIGDAVSFNAERLIGLKPDLAVMAGTAQSPALAKLEALGIPVIVLDPKSPADVVQDM
jgi:iron complex transport system substrate-binding protein